jgi:hypothetical protein
MNSLIIKKNTHTQSTTLYTCTDFASLKRGKKDARVMRATTTRTLRIQK